MEIFLLKSKISICHFCEEEEQGQDPFVRTSVSEPALIWCGSTALTVQYVRKTFQNKSITICTYFV